ncbi:glycosyltransferase, partial [Streptomyces sp. SID11385]|nr:glycosyltransferase [Streptomyces sp. SID11385]
MAGRARHAPRARRRRDGGPVNAAVPAARPVPPDLTLAVIAKEPLAGRVKTRLCPPCTP